MLKIPPGRTKYLPSPNFLVDNAFSLDYTPKNLGGKSDGQTKNRESNSPRVGNNERPLGQGCGQCADGTAEPGTRTCLHHGSDDAQHSASQRQGQTSVKGPRV